MTCQLKLPFCQLKKKQFLYDCKNCIAENTRAENVKLKYHYIVSRAVTALPQFKEWTFNKYEKDSIPGFKENGLIFLKGGDLTQEINEAKLPAVVTPISKFFHEDFFETKNTSIREHPPIDEYVRELSN